MGTDNLPVQFRYVSKRLVTDIVKQWASNRTKINVGDVGLSLGFLKVTIKTSEIDWSNEYELAKLATLAVADLTGWIDARDPTKRIPTGQYIRARMFLQQNLIPMTGWEDGGTHDVVGFAGWEVLPNVGRVFLGLVGSEANLHGVQIDPRLTRSGRTASDMRGLYELYQEMRETGDPVPSSRELRLDNEAALNSTKLLQVAADSFRGTDLMGRSELVEALIQVHVAKSNVDLQLTGVDDQDLGEFELAILGAPIWVATPPPEVDHRLLLSGFSTYQQMPPGRPSGHPSSNEVRIARTPPNSVNRSIESMFGRSSPAWTERETAVVLSADAEGAGDGWDMFDGWVGVYVDVWQELVPEGSLTGWPMSENRWHEFRMWALDMALRFANRPWPFVIPVTRRPFPFFKPVVVWNPDEFAGWITILANDKSRMPTGRLHYVLLTTGEVYPCNEDGYAREDLQTVAASERAAAAVAVLRTVARWTTPFSPWQLPDPSINSQGLVSHTVDTPNSLD